ncbi:MAG TPA: SCO family protein [Myxococcota bacterium]|nr:SCO family protein [Myxococcota bacterium]
MTAALALLLALFQPPAPGTYELPAVGQVQERSLFDPGGARVPFPGLAPGQVAVVALVYGSCHDAGGCPASLALLRELDRRLAKDPVRAARVRLDCVSFDPERDTPEQLAHLRELMAPQSDWRFLTPARAELAPLLKDFGQDVVTFADGAKRHVAKVYLLDSQRRVRNVYAPGTFDADLVLADVDTLGAGRK